MSPPADLSLTVRAEHRKGRRGRPLLVALQWRTLTANTERASIESELLSGVNRLEFAYLSVFPALGPIGDGTGWSNHS